MYLLDTNVVSELRKRDRCDENVAAWYTCVSDDELFLSVLVLGEIRRGVERIRHRDPQQCAALEQWLQGVTRDYGHRILPIEERVADTWGELYYIRNVPVVDGLLAATAKAHNLTLVTRNTQDVQGLGVDLLNPFSPTTGGN